MALSEKDVRRIADLARLELVPADAPRVLGQMAGIFALIEQMQAIDTTGVAPMAHARDVTLRLRDDIVTETDRHAAFQAIAPAGGVDAEAGLYLVPKVIE